MKSVINDTVKYWNQYHDVKDLPETAKDERSRTCNITCVAMITGEHPDKVLKKFFDKYGINDKFMWQELLVDYLIEAGFKCDDYIIKPQAYPDARHIKISELKAMRAEIDDGKIIFYHKCGHYQLMVGYSIDNEGNIDYIFNDPAGNRTKSLKYRSRKSGYLVGYPERMVLAEPIYGKCYSVTI